MTQKHEEPQKFNNTSFTLVKLSVLSALVVKFLFRSIYLSLYHP